MSIEQKSDFRSLCSAVQTLDRIIMEEDKAQKNFEQNKVSYEKATKALEDIKQRRSEAESAVRAATRGL